MKSTTIVMLLCCSAIINATSIVNQLTNALISKTDFNNVLNTQGYSNYNFSQGAACGQSTTFPTSVPNNSLKICYSTSIAFPYRNSSGNNGYEPAVTSNWQSLLQAQYGSSFSLTFVPISVTSAGLFATVQQALAAGQCDTAITSFFETSSRDSSLQPSCSYGSTFSGYLVGPKAQPAGVTITSNVASLNNSAVTIAVGNGTASLSYIQSLNLQATLVLTTSTSNSIALAANSTVNVAIGDAPVLQYYSSSNSALCGGSACPVYQLTSPSQLVAYTTYDPTAAPTSAPSTASPSVSPSTVSPSTASPSTVSPSTSPTAAPTTVRPTSRPTNSGAVTTASVLLAAAVVVALF